VAWTGTFSPHHRVVTLLRNLLGRWRRVYHVWPPSSPHGACALAPRAVVRNLYGDECVMSWRALHGRAATGRDAAVLQRLVLLEFGVTTVTRETKIHRPCISRLDLHWAAGLAEYGVAPNWFKRVRGRWRLVYAWGSSPGRNRTPRAIILSLGSCVGYWPSDFGV
jgi:hypothetical protein